MLCSARFEYSLCLDFRSKKFAGWLSVTVSAQKSPAGVSVGTVLC